MDADEETFRKSAPLASLDIIPHAACYHPTDVYTLGVTRNWKWVFTGGADGVVRKYDFFASMNGKINLPLTQRHGFIESLSKAGVLASSWENDVPRQTTSSVPISKQVAMPIHSVAVHSEGLWILTGQKAASVEKGTVQEVPIKLWTVRVYEGRCHFEFKHHRDTVSALALARDERSFVSGSWDATIQYCSLDTGTIIRSLNGHRSHITSLSFSPDLAQPLVFSTSVDGDAHFWDFRQETPVRTFHLPGPNQPWILSGCWSADGSKVYCGRKNGTVDEWDFASGTCIRPLKLPTGGAVTCVSAFPDGKHLFVSCDDNVRIWNVAEAAPKGTTPFQILPAHSTATISSVVIDEEMRYMATASGDRGWIGSTDRLALFYEIKPSTSHSIEP